MIRHLTVRTMALWTLVAFGFLANAAQQAGHSEIAGLFGVIAGAALAVGLVRLAGRVA